MHATGHRKASGVQMLAKQEGLRCDWAWNSVAVNISSAATLQLREVPG